MTAPPFMITIFDHRSARFKREVQLTLPELREMIEAQTAERKDLLPWVKFAVFGDLTSNKGSLRHDANVQCVTGCEADYDDELISFDEGKDLLKKAGVEALIYTSPSHLPDRPRWRIVCRFSERQQPERRAQMVARLNGLFHGALAAESFTLSQSYYYGHVVDADGNPVAHKENGAGIEIFPTECRAELIEGRPLDLSEDLDRSAIGKSGRKGDGSGGYDYTGNYTDLQELVRRIKTGESLHPSVTSITGKYARHKWPIEACIELVGAAFTIADQPRYSGRWQECIDAVRWVYRKEAENQQQANPTLALTYGWDTTKPQSTGTIVRGLLHAFSLTLTYGPPKSGKSFWLIALFLAIASGDKEFEGHTIVRPGPVLYVACEGHSGYWKRLKAAAISRGWKEDTFPKNFILAIGRPQLIKIDDRSHVAIPHADDVLAAVAEATAKGVEPVAVAIDTVFRSVGAGNVNASDHMNAYLAALAKITDQGIALAAVHHETKSGGTPAGSVTLIAGADTIIVFGNLEDGTHSWQVEMAKDDAETKPRKFYLQVIDVGEDLDGQPAFSCVIDEVPGEVPRKSTRKMTDQVKGFYDHFRTIMAEHAKPITPEIGMPQVTGMTRDKFREELARRGGFPEDQIGSNGKLLSRAYTTESNGLTSLKTRGFCSFNRLCVLLTSTTSKT